MFEGFLDADELAAAQEALWLHYPRPEEYFADPAAHAWLATDQWAGEVSAPLRSWNLNRLAFHPDLLDLAERFLGSADLRLSQASLWAKYAGAGRSVRVLGSSPRPLATEPNPAGLGRRGGLASGGDEGARSLCGGSAAAGVSGVRGLPRG